MGITRPRLYDIDENITLALDLLRGRTFKHFMNDRALRYALQFAILIIAEAVRHIPLELRNQHPTISWPNIVAIGNHLRHEYHRIDPAVVWDVVTVHLMPLHQAVKAMLADETISTMVGLPPDEGKRPSTGRSWLPPHPPRGNRLALPIRSLIRHYPCSLDCGKLG